MPYSMTYSTLQSDFFAEVKRSDSEIEDAFPRLVFFAQRRIARELRILGLQRYATGIFTASNGVIQKPARWLRTMSVNFGTSSGEATGATVTAGGTSYKDPVTVTSSGGGATTQATWQAFTVNGVITQIVPITPGSGYTSAPSLTITGAGSSGSGATATATISTSNIVRRILWPRSYEFCRFYWPNENTTGTPKFYCDYDFDNWLVVPTPTTAWPIQISYHELANAIDATTTTNWLTEHAPDLLFAALMCEADPFCGFSEEKSKKWAEKYRLAGAGFMDEKAARKSDKAMTNDA